MSGAYGLPKTDLYSVAATGGEPVKITTIDLQIGGFGPGGGALSLSPDGKQVAFTASTTRPITSYTQPDLGSSIFCQTQSRAI